MKVIATMSMVALAACGVSPDSAPANSFNGTVQGESLAIVEAVWVVAPFNQPGGWTGNAAFVMMSTEADLCGRVASNTALPGETRVTLEMIDIAGTSASAPTTPGSYTVPIESYWAPKTGWLGIDVWDLHCTHSGHAARSGIVNVASFEATAITGSFDVFVDTGVGEATGTYAPQHCPGLENTLSATGAACPPR